MRPLQLEVRGLMTYREQTVIDFRGDWLWSITGANGSGKSALFDAITFALYGEHRYCKGRSSRDELLLSEDRDHLRVAFDFEISGAPYRVERTIARRGGRNGWRYAKSWQAYELGDAATGSNVAVPIPGTDSSSGLDRWVVKTLGISARAFVSAILLRQGDAERFLNASPDERQKVLLEMLDLQPYVRLEELAKQHAREVKHRIDAKDAEIAPLADVTSEAIAVATEAFEQAQRELTCADRRVEEAVARLQFAETFARVSADLRTVRTELESANEVIADAASIESDWREKQALEKAVPLLERAVRLEGNTKQAAERVSALEQQAEQIDLATLQRRKDDAQALEESLVESVEQARHASTQARETKTQLQPLYEASLRWVRLREELDNAGTRIEAFQADLRDGESWEALRKESELAAAALPYLRELRRQRCEVREAFAAAERLRRESDALNETLSELQARAVQSSKIAGEATQQVDAVRHKFSLACAELEHAAQLLKSRTDAGQEGTCSHCGQRVDLAHIEREISTARRHRAEVETNVEILRERLHSAEERQAELTNAAVELDETLAETRQRLAEAERDLDRQVERHDKGARCADSVIEQLPAAYMAQVSDGTYPSSNDLGTVQVLAAELGPAQEKCAGLQLVRGQVQALIDQQARWLDGVHEIEHEYGCDKLEAVAGEYATAHAAVLAAERDEQTLQHAYSEALRALADARRVLEEGERAHEKIQVAVARERNRIDADSSAARELRSEVAREQPEWAELDAPAVSLLAERLNSLSDIEQRRADLERARQDAGRLRGQEGVLRNELEAVPEQHRVPIAVATELKNDETRRRDQLQSALGGAHELVVQLDERFRRKERLQTELDELLRDRQDYQELARLFGKEMLQAWLVQDAQETIASQANEFLAHISEGMLRIDLRRDGEELDLLVSDLTSANHPLDAAGISGSQRFRVAVAITLAVGEYSGQGSRRIRSVIIDEGFGGLDEMGRDEMIAQIKSLSGLLDCVILVSHQETFQDAFPNGYHVRKVGTVSQIERRWLACGSDPAETLVVST